MISATRRDYGIDLLKCIAIFGVIVIHSCSYAYALRSFDWYATVFWGSLVRASVPIFLMCSGALFLGRDEPLSMKKLFTHTLPRILAALIVWAMLYKLYRLMMGGGLSGAAVFQAVKEVLLFHHESHLYYLHIIIIVYLLLPLTDLVARNASRRLLEYLLLFWFVFGILYPAIAGVWPFTLLRGIPTQYKLNMTYAAVGYGLLGFYMKKYPPRRWVCAGLAVLGFLIIFCGTVILSIRENALYEGFFNGMAPGACFLAAGIFGCFSPAKPPASPIFRGTAEYVSKASFCVYLSHLIFLWQLARIGLTAQVLPAIICAPLRALCCLLCSLALYFILSHIPIVKKWLI